jgi:prepilin-type N-terminal cleavage/methylation domain-containing protein
MVYNQMKYQTRKSQKVFVNRNNKNSNLGFSLLELTIVLTIMAIVISFGIFSMSKIISARGDNKAVEDMQKVKEAIERFRVQNGRYPCPASLIAGDGQEATEGVATPPHNACYNSTATRTVAADGFARVKPVGGTTDESSVIIGAVPFAALGIDPKYGVDKWGNKYVYAVTEVLAADINNTTSYATDNAVLAFDSTKLKGAIDIKDAFSPTTSIAGYNDTTPDLNKAANYLLLSHGPDGNGAFNAKGSTQGICVTTGIGEKENENCNYTGVNFADANFVVSGTLNTTTDNNYFYDLLIWDSVFSNNLSVTGSQDIRDGLKISGTDVATGRATFEVVKGESTLNCTKADKCITPATQYALKVQGSTNLKCADLTGGCDGASEYALKVEGKTNLGGTTVLPDQTESFVCNSSNEGATRYNNTTKILQACDGANWVPTSTFLPGTLAGWCWRKFGLWGGVYDWPVKDIWCTCETGWAPRPISLTFVGVVPMMLYTCIKEGVATAPTTPTSQTTIPTTITAPTAPTISLDSCTEYTSRTLCPNGEVLIGTGSGPWPTGAYIKCCKIKIN